MNFNVILSPYILGTEQEEIIALHIVEVKGRMSYPDVVHKIIEIK